MNKLNIILARVMIYGIVVAASVMVAGYIWYLSIHHTQIPSDHIFTGEPHFLKSPGDMLHHITSPEGIGSRRSLMMAGVLLLLISPLIRVGLAWAGYLIMRDWLYAVFSFIVLLVLTLSFFL
ncbi:MAG: DUF1634 domain-containing protein [Verrucomicrobiota bacterium]|nr:DUF1634 domain-containing protein [Verrucomicrobiota bacterium]